jgi:hypothetical protein
MHEALCPIPSNTNTHTHTHTHTHTPHPPKKKFKKGKRKGGRKEKEGRRKKEQKGRKEGKKGMEGEKKEGRNLTYERLTIKRLLGEVIIFKKSTLFEEILRFTFLLLEKYLAGCGDPYHTRNPSTQKAEPRG